MTSPHVSEQEVEAALLPIASAMFESYYSAIGNDKPNLLNEPASSIKLWKEDAYPVARAALTAAAQVRERAVPAQPNAWLTDIENAPKDGSDVIFPFEFFVSAYWDKDLSRWVLNYPVRYDYVTNPDRYRLPSRAPTEPDSGPDVLGERKGD